MALNGDEVGKNSLVSAEVGECCRVEDGVFVSGKFSGETPRKDLLAHKTDTCGAGLGPHGADKDRPSGLAHGEENETDAVRNFSFDDGVDMWPLEGLPWLSVRSVADHSRDLVMLTVGL
ncbi:hypothetical protein SARC_11778 [Sphaeroforma arctica JP610]|uniref:Uncharacterized protein n=1 Tax=Sphaeroforma arctica JP610 TaxID=667725 RepID=A0A0L0FG07_9EUKA|nr:hypothetical protein SARC_11778 [Sphaeroforma arctica JP610]KNC75704.1 hypothetical protein SARC_11778 [Sphaeroforma arctica JP610]|eukprot:XP_014149606.1 hypothetical protein SARC_11778 [Sphaeroforma arctica JP610]